MATYIAGLDLGQASDYTAAAVLEKTMGPDPANPKRHASRYAVRHLHRWPLGTSYVHIGAELKAILSKPPLPNCLLAVDQTGVGRGVVDHLRAARLPARLWPITIHGGDQVTREGASFRVPKKELVSCLQLLLQGKRFEVARSLPQAQLLVKELLAFKVKQNLATGHESFEAWRERDHDDLVLAVALAAWLGESGVGRPFSAAVGGVRPMVASFERALRRNLPEGLSYWP